MNCLTLFLHPSEEFGALDALRASPEVTGFTLTRCEGHGAGPKASLQQSAMDEVVGFVPRIRIEVILPSEAVDSVLERLKSGLGFDGPDHYSVTSVLRMGTLLSLIHI